MNRKILKCSFHVFADNDWIPFVDLKKLKLTFHDDLKISSGLLQLSRKYENIISFSQIQTPDSRFSRIVETNLDVCAARVLLQKFSSF